MKHGALLGVLLLLAACEEARIDDVSTDECISGRKWAGGNAESPLMHPGGDCIGCHRREGEGPRFLVAGTVYEGLDEPNDCLGLEGVRVEVTDARGEVWSTVTNEAGNFWIAAHEGPLEFPFTAKVIADGMEAVMVAPQSTGSCATCHTATGANAAAGRIIAP